jgi:uncharacterized protein
MTARAAPMSCVYAGEVVHHRVRPKPHGLKYQVFSLLLDVDEVDALDRRLWLFSRNRWNVVSFYDRDHGAGTPGMAIADHARATFAAAGLGAATARIFLLAYPRIVGYGFNPISVYYGYGSDGHLAGLIYEVNNTFGERRSYVVPVAGAVDDDAHTVHAHGCKKELYVSPFTDMAGRYSFRVREPADETLLAVNLRDDDGPLLRTHFRANRLAISDGVLARLMMTLPFLTLKVIAAIHLEAARLWLKGVPLTTRPAAARYAVTHVLPPARS